MGRCWHENLRQCQSSRSSRRPRRWSRQARADGHAAAIAGGGTDLLGMIKERIVTPDVLVNLKSIKGLDSGDTAGRGA